MFNIQKATKNRTKSLIKQNQKIGKISLLIEYCLNIKIKRNVNGNFLNMLKNLAENTKFIQFLIYDCRKIKMFLIKQKTIINYNICIKQKINYNLF